MPEPRTARQPRKARRFWLFAPYVAVLAALIAWSGVWWSMKLKLEHELAERSAALRAQGYAIAWTGESVRGWPFRLNLTLTGARLGEPSGWAVAAPRIEGLVLPYALDHWIFAAPDGLTLTRPGKGDLNVAGRAIRASVSGLGGAAPLISFEGRDLAMAPLAGAQPSPIISASILELHLKPGPDDQAALLLRIEGAGLQPAASLAQLEPGKLLDVTWDTRLSHRSAFKGAGWAAALQAWTAAGGAMTVADGKIVLGGLSLQGQGGPLTVGPDGRLRGALPLKVKAGKAGVLTLAGPLALHFEDGRAAIGPIPLGPALKIG